VVRSLQDRGTSVGRSEAPPTCRVRDLCRRQSDRTSGGGCGLGAARPRLHRYPTLSAKREAASRGGTRTQPSRSRRLAPGLDLQEDPEHRGIGLGGELALPRVPAVLRVERVEPNMMVGDLERAERIGEFRSYPQSRTFAELPIDCEEDRMLRAVLVGMLRSPGDGWKATAPATSRCRGNGLASGRGAPEPDGRVRRACAQCHRRGRGVLRVAIVTAPSVAARRQDGGWVSRI
jgi:hypothetical protein